ncbi:hypothetical protein MRB53_039630 [Persea americana]|nr:hypothetical protein MRB53_039630 [Persea americana]
MPAECLTPESCSTLWTSTKPDIISNDSKRKSHVNQITKSHHDIQRLLHDDHVHSTATSVQLSSHNDCAYSKALEEGLESLDIASSSNMDGNLHVS